MRAHSRVVIVLAGQSKVRSRRHQGWERNRETRLEFERVDADGDGTDHAGVEFLIVRLALGAPDVGQFPFEVWCCQGRR